jgi:carboxypeptidase T
MLARHAVIESLATTRPSARPVEETVERLKQLAMLSILILAVTPAVTAHADGLPAPGERWALVVTWSDRAVLDRLASELDVREVDTGARTAVVDVGARELEWVRSLGIPFRVDPVRTAALNPRMTRLPRQTEGISGYPCYRTVEETLADIQSLATAHPDIIEVLDIGDSWEKIQGGPLDGYDLLVMRMTNRATPGPKPVLWLEGAIHARELTTAETVMRFAEQLASRYGVDPEATWVLDHHEIHILPQGNPDGRKMAEIGLSWRKNTNSSDGCSDSASWGVDLNRNFPFQWGCCGGSSTDPCSITHRGSSAASEPEVVAIVDHVRSVIPDQRPDDLVSPAPLDTVGLFIDVHSYGGDVLSSWGFSTSTPPNGTGILGLAEKFAWYNGYDAKLGSYSTVDGSAKDFAYGELGVPAYTFELGTAFFEDCSTFESTVFPDNIGALWYAAKAAGRPYEWAFGPDAVSVVLTPDTVAPGDPVEVTATLDDTRFAAGSGQPIRTILGGEVTVGEPPWADGVVPYAMSAEDGVFDENVEPVSAIIDTTDLGHGRHLVYVRGEDADGHQGPPTAAYLTVLDPDNAPRIAGTVRDAQTLAPVAATVTAGSFSDTTDPVTGEYEMLTFVGTYTVLVSADGYSPAEAPGVQAVSGTTTVQDFLMSPFLTVFSDDAEGPDPGWTADPPWQRTSSASVSPSHSWTDSPTGVYGNGVDVSLTSPVLDLTGLSGTVLEFWHTYAIDAGWDVGRVEISSNGGTSWTVAASYDGDQVAWDRVTIDLSQLDGAAQARFRFRLISNEIGGRDGWYLDDIAVRAAGPLAPGPAIFADGFESGDTTRWTVP